MFGDLIKQQKNIVTILTKQYKQKRLSHAYLFAGPLGTQKYKAALFFACMQYCGCDTPCGVCDACLSIINEKHMNVYHVRPDGQNIRKEQIIALQDEFSKSSLVVGPRIYIISDADRMNTSSFNSLLKFLEEPFSLDVYAVLLTTRPDLILTTIKSRTVIMEFHAANHNILQQILLENNVFKSYSLVLPFLTNGLEGAQEMLRNGIFTSCFTVLIDYIRRLHKRDLSILFYMEHYESIANKESMRLFTSLLILLYRDIYSAFHNQNVIVYQEHSDEIKEISKYYTKEDLVTKMDLLIKYEEQLNFNVNFDLIFLELLLKLKGGSIR